MAKYVIDESLRGRLLYLLSLLIKHHIGDEDLLVEIQTDLEEAEKVIEESEYDGRVEELLYYAKEIGLL